MSFKIEITEEEIKQRIKELAKEISNHYRERNIIKLYLIFILTGAFVFAADIIRELSRLEQKLLVDAISIKSYVGMNAGEIQVNLKDIYRKSLDNRHVLIIDDILDTGATLEFLHGEIMKHFRVKSVEFCCLLEKENMLRNLSFDVKFMGFKVPNEFIIGYGLDFNGKYRELPYIAYISQQEDENEGM